MQPNKRAASRRVAPVIAIVHSDIPPDAPPDDLDTLYVANIVHGWLEELGYSPFLIPYKGEATLPLLKAAGTGAIFNLVESIDGSVRHSWQAMATFERWGIPFVGADATTTKLTTDKILTKSVLARHNIPTAPHLTEAGIEQCRHLDGRHILKARDEECSIGIYADSVTDNPDTLRAVLADRKSRYGGEWFAEAYIDGRECHVPVIDGPDGPRILPPVEMVFDGFDEGMVRIDDYNAKWIRTSPEFLKMGRLFLSTNRDPDLCAALEALTLECWRIFGLRGWARVDFRINAEGRPFVLELNTNACLDDREAFIASAREAGLSPLDLITCLMAALPASVQTDALR